jgi:hypothetical protein
MPTPRCRLPPLYSMTPNPRPYGRSWTDGVVLLRRVASQSRPTSIIVRHSWLSERRCNHVIKTLKLVYCSSLSTDASTMELYHMVCGLNPRVRLATEMVHPSNVAYLAPLVPLQGLGLKQQVMLSPAYMSGQVFTSDFVDYLMLQVRPLV